MEASHSRLTTGEQSGGQEHRRPESRSRGPQPKSPSQPRRNQRAGSPKPHGTPQQAKQSKRQHPGRKRLRHQRQSVDSDTASEHKHDASATTKATAVASLSPEVPSSSAGGAAQNEPETPEGALKQKRERKPQIPGKYVCTYCGRGCAKPSVLQKHIRSHTGERPYPCSPCGFSFKTKSNLYKHRKSHAHRVKASMALGEPRPSEEQVTESEDETRQLPSASSHTERHGGVAPVKSCEPDMAKDCAGGNNDSYAVKKRLALRLSRGKHGLQDSSDEKTSSLVLGSKGSTESGYFSRSESTDQSQDSPQNTSAKSYAEIILGKYGRLGHLQRMPVRHNQQPSGEEDKGIPFTVPKKQVIDHITKLITINEAVVDTSKIDSVKPRRFSLSRKNSSESQKSLSVKEQLVRSPKVGDLGFKSSGSISMGVPCEKFHHPSLNVEEPTGQTSAPLSRSHSVPTAASSFDTSSCGPGKLSQSFDERRPSERQASRRYAMLRRQPAIEIPLGAEPAKEEREVSRPFHPESETTTPDHKPRAPQLYECEACGNGCKDWEGYKRHKQSLCSVHRPRHEMSVGEMECSQLINHSARAGASTMRKRRKEDSFEFDEPSSPSLPSSALVSGQGKDDSNVVCEGSRRPALQTCSVIQHTSSFEKQESSLCKENRGAQATKNYPPHEEHQLPPQKLQHQSTKPANQKLVRQPNVPVPEILVTVDSNASTRASMEPTPKAKHSEKPREFQWPQRSPSLSLLPIEKLPPKKKRLRLAEAAQSSGESSFESMSLPRSPSQDSTASYASSRSTSFEESSRPDTDTATLTPLRISRASDMLTVPGAHQHREMRRSASEQAPHDQQPSVLETETRSKSFDYSCLSPERTAAGWRERRKCLLVRHTALRDPDEEEEEHRNLPIRCPERVGVSASQASPASVSCGRSPASPLSGETVLSNPIRLQCKEIFSPWNLGQNIQLTGSTELSRTHCTSAEPVKEEAGQSPPQAPQPYPTHGPSGAARARYLPMSTGLKLEIPSLHDGQSEGRVSHSHIQHPAPRITSSQELVRPVTSPAVAVRLQTDTLTLGCAIYTTLSQVASPKPEEKLDAFSRHMGVPTAEHRNPSPVLQLRSDDDSRISGSGGNKRMLSPSNSIEIHPESQQQQKRVKEEEETEVGCADRTSVVTCNQELKGENRPCPPSVRSPSKPAGSSFPSLLSSTSNSWCCLNHIKPSPTPLEEQEPSVYSAWSTSGDDPNPPGLSSKTALSLLHCKQRLSPSIYTVSPITDRTTESAQPEDRKRPRSTEVCGGPSHCRDRGGSRKGRRPADDTGSKRKEEGAGDEEEEEGVPSCSKDTYPPGACISDRRSTEMYAMVHAGRGRGGRSQREGCGARQEGPQGTAGLSERGCKRRGVPFTAGGSLAEDHLGSRGAECCGYPEATGQGVCKESHPQREKDHRHSGRGKSGHDEDDDDDATDREGRRDEDIRSRASESSNAASGDGEESQPGEQPMEPQPSRSTRSSSASLRRALFARRRLDASSPASSGGPRSPGAPSPPPPPRGSSPGPPAAARSLPPSSCGVSASALGPASPDRGPSPVMVQSHGAGSSEPPGSRTGTSAECHACLHPSYRPSTARPSVDEVGPSPTSPHPTRPQGADHLLSHLPLHSQQPSRAPSLLTPVGGIHLIQPRFLPLYSLVSSPAAAPANHAGASWRLSDAPKGRSPLLLRQDTLKEASPSGPSSPPDPGAFGSGPPEASGHAASQGRFSVRQPSRTETMRPEVNTDPQVTESRVNPETT